MDVFYRHPCCELFGFGDGNGGKPRAVVCRHFHTVNANGSHKCVFYAHMGIWCKGTNNFFITLKNFEKFVFLSFLKRNKTFFFSC